MKKVEIKNCYDCPFMQYTAKDYYFSNMYCSLLKRDILNTFPLDKNVPPKFELPNDCPLIIGETIEYKINKTFHDE